MSDEDRWAKDMNEKAFSPFFRPVVVAAAFLIFFCGFLVMKGRDLSIAKIALVGSWFIIGAVAVAAFQSVRKKELGWIGASVGVTAVGMLVAVVMLAMKSGQFITR